MTSCTQLLGGIDDNNQHRLYAFLTNPLTPAGKARSVHRRFRLVLGLTHEVLDVGVLHSDIYDLLIGTVIGLLQIKHSRHQFWR